MKILKGLLLSSSALVLIGGGIAATADATTSKAPAVKFSACLSSVNETLSRVTVNGRLRCSTKTRLVTWNAQGPRGFTGVAGAVGATGATGTTGATGAVGATGARGLAGPTGARGLAGATGTLGTSVTSSALSTGNANCPWGGSSFTGASGTTFACNAAPEIENVTWNPSVSVIGQVGQATSNTTFESGATLTATSATLTGDLSSCTAGYLIDLESSGHLAGTYLATWSTGSAGIDETSPLAANSYVGTARTATSSGPFEILGTCDALVSGNPVPANFPSGVQISATIQWTHAVPTRAIN